MNCYNKEGQPISQEDWLLLFNNSSYQIIAKTTFGPYLVSTVWLGLNHNYSDGLPLIFETIIFPEHEEGVENIMWRYSTIEEAQRGHKVACKIAEKRVSKN